MRAAVIPTMGRAELAPCIKAIAEQVDLLVLVAHNWTPSTPVRHYGGVPTHVVVYTENPPNISRMWNIGLDMAEGLGAEHTAVLNDDAIVPANWFTSIRLAMQETKCIAGFSAGDHDSHLVYRRAEPTMRRMTGFAFVVPANARADEQFQWWYGDNDLEWRLRQEGGVVQIGGDVDHRHPNETTVGELAAIAGADKVRFKAKWGRLP